MRKPERGIACAGCPHRAAYVAVKEALGRGRGRVYCGDAGCAAVGPLHPAATTCPGGEAALLPRYRQAIPAGTDADRAQACAHFITDRALMRLAAHDATADASEADPTPEADPSPETVADSLDHLDREGETVLLCVLASSAHSLTDDALVALADAARAHGAADAVTVDPFDTLAADAAVTRALAFPGVHAIIFASPCAQLLRATSDAAPTDDTSAAAAASANQDDPQPLDPVEIDRYACVGCQRCVQITGCPALAFVPPVCTVDAAVCAGCDLCCDYCRTHVIYTPRQRMAPAARHAARVAAATR